MRGSNRIMWVAPRTGRGLSILYLVVLLPVVGAFAALAVDIGRTRLARAEVQTAADAAAHSGARSLPISSNAVIDNASDAADANGVIDQETSQTTTDGARTNPGVTLVPDEDVEFGIWNPEGTWGDSDNPKWKPLGGEGTTTQDERRRANAVRVTARRLEERDNPIPLVFAPVLRILDGDAKSTADIELDAIAYITSGPGDFAFVGIDKVHFNGNGSVDSMRYGQNGTGGGVASDGNVELGNGDVYGDARPGISGQLTQKANSIVTGWTANLDYTLASRPEYQAKTTPIGTPTYNPPTGKVWTFPPAGVTPSTNPNNPLVYRMDSLTLNGNKSIQVNGYVVVYVEGDVKIDGNHVTNNGTPPNPSQFTVIVVGAHSVDIGGNDTQYMHLDAPESAVKVHGGANMQYYGWIISKTLTIDGSSNLHYDESHDFDHHYNISLVK